jgi:hypothetical protein
MSKTRQVSIGFEPSESDDVVAYEMKLYDSEAFDKAGDAEDAAIPDPVFMRRFNIADDADVMTFDVDQNVFMIELNKVPEIETLDGTYHVMISAIDDAENVSEGAMVGYVELDFLAPSAPPRVFVVRL